MNTYILTFIVYPRQGSRVKGAIKQTLTVEASSETIARRCILRDSHLRGYFLDCFTNIEVKEEKEN